jgi:hypothetical protein
LNLKIFISKGNLPIVALCFFIASSFWIVNALNKTYNTKIKIPMLFKYNKEKIYASKTLPTKLWVDAQSTGWILLQHKLGLKNDTLNFNIGYFFENSQTVTKEDLIRFINNNTKGVVINQILDDDISFEFEVIRQKKITIELDSTNTTFPNNLVLKNIEISPKEIIISGPSSSVRHLNNKYIVNIDPTKTTLENIQTFEQILELDTQLTPHNPKIKITLYFKSKNG